MKLFVSRTASLHPQSKGLFKRLFALSVLIAFAFVLYLDITVVANFSGQKWRLPTHVYARPMEFYVGENLQMPDLIWELDSLGYRNKAQLYDSGQYRVNGRKIEIRTRGFDFWDGIEPAQSLKLEFSGDQLNSQLTSLTNAFGTPLPIARLEPLRIGGIYPNTLEDRKLVLLNEIPSLLVDSLIAVEDRTFYEHWGLSIRGILRALKADIQAGAAVQGGSTLTQQLIKNFYLSSERSLSRKLLELFMAPLLELHYDKDEILETYLNEVYFGQSGKRSIQGVGLASYYYFGQPLNELAPHQIAFLIGVIKGPSQYDPWRRPEQTKQRRDLVLSVMAAHKLITDQQAERYQELPLDVWQRPARSLNPYPAYMSLVRGQLGESFDIDDLEQGLNIYTSLDPIVQRKLEQVAETELKRIENQRGLPANTLETGALVTRLGSSKIVALIGGRQSGFDGFNRATQAKRAIGSLIKPAIYLTALQKPGASWANTVSDEPLSVDAPDNTVWQPRNYDKESHGNLIMLDALINSYNQATARLGLNVGVDSVIKTVKKLGVDVDWKPYPAILLGSGAMSPLEVSALYQTMANDGFSITPSVLESVYSTDQEPLKRYRGEPVQKIDPAHAHLIQYALQMVMLEGTGKSAFNWLDKERRVAGKTGTTNDQRDSWFAGFGGEYLTVFWLGRDDNEPMPLTGATGALRLWSKLMSDIEQQSIDFIQPKQIKYKWINRQEGGLSAANCDGAILLPLIKGTEPNYRDDCAQKVVPRVLDWFRNVLDI